MLNLIRTTLTAWREQSAAGNGFELAMALTSTALIPPAIATTKIKQ